MSGPGTIRFYLKSFISLTAIFGVTIAMLLP